MTATKSRYKKASKAVLAWYEKNARTLPWRIHPQQRNTQARRTNAYPNPYPNPYHVWLSEIMLQQTTVATVTAYFEKFIARWPRISHLASAERNDVMAAWAGLGYYARARNLHETAKIIVRDYDGIFPDTEDALKALPGIGDYTAAAIAAIAFGRRAIVLDGNIERIMARWDRIETPLPEAKKSCYEVMDHLTPDEDFVAGDFAQALMDIGATICTPARKASSGKISSDLSSPSCALCPLSQTCIGKDHDPARLPLRLPKKPRPDRYGHVLIIRDSGGHVVLTSRPDRGLLGGLEIFPTNDWPDGGGKSPQDGVISDHHEASRLYHLFGRGEILGESVVHIFTHFRVLMRLEIISVKGVKPRLPKNFFWAECENLRHRALPTVMTKCARACAML